MESLEGSSKIVSENSSLHQLLFSVQFWFENERCLSVRHMEVKWVMEVKCFGIKY